MTDLDKFLKLYESFGVYLNYELIPKKQLQYYQLIRDEDENELFKVVRLNKDSYYTFQGYGGFLTEIIFSNEGQFLTQGFWE